MRRCLEVWSNVPEGGFRGAQREGAEGQGGPEHHHVPATALRAGPRRWVTGRLYPQKTERRVAEPPAWTFFFVYSGGKQCLVSWNGAGLGAVCLPAPEHGEYSFCREGEAG